LSDDGGQREDTVADREVGLFCVKQFKPALPITPVPLTISHADSYPVV